MDGQCQQLEPGLQPVSWSQFGEADMNHRIADDPAHCAGQPPISQLGQNLIRYGLLGEEGSCGFDQLLNHAIWYAGHSFATPYPGESRVLLPSEVTRAPARIRQEILERVARVEPDERDRVRALLDLIFREWRRLPPDVYGTFSTPADSVPFMYPSGTHPSEQWDDRAYATPSSMRNCAHS